MKELDFIKIGERIRAKRLQMGYTQDYLANYLDVDASHISNIEHGRCKVSLTALVGISNALNCSVDLFIIDEYTDPSIALYEEISLKLKNADTELLTQISRIIDVLK